MLGKTGDALKGNDTSIQKYSEDCSQVKWSRFPMRVRPHRNPLADGEDDHPDSPDAVPWQDMYPKMRSLVVKWLDVGSAYGGMLCKLGPMEPNTLMLGLEIRPRVAEFAQQRVREHRANKNTLHNVWFEQSNVMRYLPYWFRKGQLEKMFFCYPDPHWKKRNLRRRIMGQTLVHEYAYVLAPGGRLYTVSDVPELEAWMIEMLDLCPLFKRLPEDEVASDPLLEVIVHSSEDAMRSQKRGTEKKAGQNWAIHVRV